jgi:Fe-S cluster biogenesis protein NfuA/nitrite reductase/ring-hydroxylating ferredoxin subunit
MTGVQQVNARVEELLKSLSASAAAPAAEELVGLLVNLYGDALAQIIDLVGNEGPHGQSILAKLADDPLIESLLLLHGLHPLDLDARIQRALDRVRPYLGSHAGGVEYLGVTDGVARLKLEGSCHGCPSSTVTVQLAIEDAVLDAAPEVSSVVVEGMTAAPGPKLLQIGKRPAGGPGGSSRQDGTASVVSETQDGGTWVTLPQLGPPSSRPLVADAAGTAVLLCSVRGTLYAYLDRCASCGSSLADGTLDREELTCAGCGARFNVRLAGKDLADSGLHLDPLPLLTDSQGVRVAVSETVRT